MPVTAPVILKGLLENPELQLTLENLDEPRIASVEVWENRVQVVGLSIAGFTAHLYQKRVQLFGKSEIDYLNTLTDEEKLAKSELFLREKPVAVIFTDPVRPPDYFRDLATTLEVPLFTTRMSSSIFLDFIKDYLNRLLATNTTLHAQLIDVFGVGILIMGESGVGKSETSLDLVMKGHKLIADDVVEIKYIPPDHLIGTSNEMMRNLIEIRGVGLIDLQRMFGVTSTVLEKEIDTVVRLALWDENHQFEYERIGSTTRYFEVLGVKKPYYLIPVRHGSNLSSVIEVVARDYMLKRQGINVAEEFERKLEKKLSEFGGG